MQDGAWVQTGEVRRVYDGMNVVQERDAQNNPVCTYTRKGNIGGILARTDANGSLYYHYDGRGNVSQLTDASAAVTARYSYDAFGNTSTSGTAASLNRYRFSTKEQIGGLYCYGYRFYSPGLGRWINRDPIAERGGLNLYAAVRNDPVNKKDAYGLFVPTPGYPTLPPGAPSPIAPPLTPPVAPPITPPAGGLPAMGVGGVAIGITLWAGWEICSYRPCRPSGPLTWIGDRLADKVLGEPCGGEDERPPTEAECRAAYDECSANCTEEAGEGRDYDPIKYRECLYKCQDDYEDCQKRRG